MDGVAAPIAEAEDEIPDGYESVEEFLAEARKRFQEGEDADRENRDAALDDLKFLTGEEQWDPIVKEARLKKGRPCLTINTLPQFVGQVIGDTRSNRPSIKVRPAEDGDKDVAELRQGLIRYIENQSGATQVYALAGEDQVGCGIGHFRVGLTYADGDTFDQDIRIQHIPNPFAVVWDPLSVEPTGEDARFCFVVDEMDRDTFKRVYPDATETSLSPNMADQGWVTRDSVRITEYWFMKEQRRKLGLVLTVPNAQPTVEDITGREKELAGSLVSGPDGRPKVREVTKRSACMYLTNGIEVLDGPYEYPISRLPIIKVTGREIRVAERRYRFGLIRFAKDSVRMKNLWRSSAAEWLAMAPKSQWLLHATDEKEANRYRNAAKSGDTVLVYSGQVPPQRLDPPTAANALLQEAQLNDQDIKDVTGLHDASLGMRSNETSGRAILARERQGDVATFMYHDNLNAAVRAGGRVINELLPVVFDTARTVTILGEDEVTQSKRINDPADPASLDLGNGKFDVVVETGPSYSTKRQEAAESMMAFVQAVPAAGQAAADLIAEAQDWPMAGAIASRLKKALPPNLQEQDPKDMTPEEQQQRQQAMQQAAEQQQMAKQAAMLELDGKAAEIEYKRAQAAKLQAESQPEAPEQPDQIDYLMKLAELRKAEAEADEAEAKAQTAKLSINADYLHKVADLESKVNPPPEAIEPIESVEE